MLISTIILFALAAILGVTLIAKVLKGEGRPRAVVYSHGIAAALALVLLIIAYANEGDSLLMVSILIFIVAALGGFVMFSQEITQKPIPKWLALVHGLAAVTGFVLLLIAALG